MTDGITYIFAKDEAHVLASFIENNLIQAVKSNNIKSVAEIEMLMTIKCELLWED